IAGGLVLRPKVDRGVRGVELAGDTINLDGVPATGAELRQKLGADADLILRLSYLDPTERRQLLASGPAAAAPPERPAAPVAEPPAREEAPRRRGRRASGDDRVRFGGSVTVEEGEVV